jgi:hypothetical protein
MMIAMMLITILDLRLFQAFRSMTEAVTLLVTSYSVAFGH